jgi:glycosyltransferase A (GT-A) superfamily protein (DUF2064 family)
VIVPGDVPGLGLPQLRRAFDLLRDHAVVLGPGSDGGVYLLGCHGPSDHVLAGVRWQTRFVLHDLLVRAGTAPLLPALGDLDCAADLPRLVRAAVADPVLVGLLKQIRGDGAPAAPGEPERAPARPELWRVAPRGPPATA